MANIVNIKIDVREQKLIALCRELTDIPIDAVPLEIGDIIIEKSDSTPSVIIERKSLSDLASSIKDGRYEEQSHRLSNSTNHANHNIVYLVEGTMKSKVMGLPDETLYSAMFSLNYYKGFSVLRTFDLNETATVICNMAMKLKKEKTRTNLKKLGCLFESFLGALFLDFNKIVVKDEDKWFETIFVTGPGFQLAQKFVENIFEKHIDWVALLQNDDNYKNILQVKVQKEFKVTPHYLEISHDMETGYKMGVYLCIGQSIHLCLREDAIDIAELPSFPEIHQG